MVICICIHNYKLTPFILPASRYIDEQIAMINFFISLFPSDASLCLSLSLFLSVSLFLSLCVCVCVCVRTRARVCDR